MNTTQMLTRLFQKTKNISKDAQNYIEIKHFKHLLPHIDLSALNIEDVNQI